MGSRGSRRGTPRTAIPISRKGSADPLPDAARFGSNQADDPENDSYRAVSYPPSGAPLSFRPSSAYAASVRAVERNRVLLEELEEVRELAREGVTADPQKLKDAARWIGDVARQIVADREHANAEVAKLHEECDRLQERAVVERERLGQLEFERDKLSEEIALGRKRMRQEEKATRADIRRQMASLEAAKSALQEDADVIRSRAQGEAARIVAKAQEEAAAITSQARARAREEEEAIVRQAREQAREDLHRALDIATEAYERIGSTARAIDVPYLGRGDVSARVGRLASEADHAAESVRRIATQADRDLLNER